MKGKAKVQTGEAVSAIRGEKEIEAMARGIVDGARKVAGAQFTLIGCDSAETAAGVLARVFEHAHKADMLVKKERGDGFTTGKTTPEQEEFSKIAARLVMAFRRQWDMNPSVRVDSKGNASTTLTPIKSAKAPTAKTGPEKLRELIAEHGTEPEVQRLLLELAGKIAHKAPELKAA